MTMPLALRLARRELRGGLKGFRIFLACLAIGVAAIAAAGSLNASLRSALEQDARALLGGDVSMRLTHSEASPEQVAWLEERGDLSSLIEMRAMAAGGAEGARTLVELKGIDGPYPLYGELRLSPEMGVDEALGQRNGLWGAVADRNLLDRLGLEIGDRLTLGDADFELRGVIEHEPDRVAAMLSFGPRVMVESAAMAETGLLQPGSMIHYVYRVRLPPTVQAAAFVDQLEAEFPRAGWRVRTLEEAAPGIRRFLDNMTVFLTLVGLTSLLVGGIGVANAVKSFIEGRVRTIAILKTVGAEGRMIFAVYFAQIAVLALLGIAIGLAVGAALPPLAILLAGDRLPLDARIGVYGGPLLLAGVFGALTALAFTLWPLARAREIPAASLFRDTIVHGRLRPRLPTVVSILAAGLALSGLAVITAERPMLAAWFVLGSLLALVVFQGAAGLVIGLARRLSQTRAERSGTPRMRLALGNLHRPGAPTASVVLSLGLGVTVLVAIALIEGNLTRQIDQDMPARAPAYFFIDIQRNQAEAFRQAVSSVPGAGEVKMAPTIRGHITHIAGRPVDEVTVDPSVEWAIRGDRGITAAEQQPADSRLVAGQWWDADYQGPPLASLTADIARGFGIGVGDTITLSILGRPITVTIASLREVDWSSLAMNFSFVLTPHTLAGAPYTYIATVQAEPEAETAVERAVTQAMPNVSAIRVREALEQVSQMMEDSSIAIRAAAGITLLAGALVLSGAVAATHRRRVYEAVVLKVVGVTRADLWRAFLLEYGLLGAATGLVAGIIGAIAAWAVSVHVLRLNWVLLPDVALWTIVACMLATMVVGFAGTWKALGAKVAPYLRNE
ncbi:ABC transporter permease [Telmatospirillum sp. J64-1]|uniref:ABC transporter permease n=1 Tax=Telmatospirillum sp. J64-1 TaxID=2502183 RepID=UPI00115CBAFF|nr:FtsX-like permease family protein [Telmatospirillum sp. J64-1]